MPIRRCSGLSTNSSPPRDHQAWPPRLCAVLLVEHEDALAGEGELVGRDQPGEAGADHDDVGGEAVGGGGLGHRDSCSG